MAKIIISSRLLRSRIQRLLKGLELEIRGLDTITKPTCYDIVCEKYNLSGTPEEVYAQLKKRVEGC